ncbi:hypothetical protein E2562_026241 [Oryza meyeriana var. granulata]|uniref:Uncharacterized protein n=1 Tax=Oryza meyeriana var. granulata TaxID=110450 RepID=A0A6G1CIL4_9ORYZ|nr:hypothetical protein E2562_026241 [Oryza meyeriana var. granulata]
MEATAVSVGKSVVDGALGYARSAVAEEVALQLGIHRDHAFIRDELHMMQAFLMAAHDERDEHKVVKAWVQQVRDLAYDVEDCLQDFAVRVGKPSWWRKCSPRTLLERRSVANKMKELRAKVEDVSQRSVRYRLIDGTSRSKAAADAAQSTIGSATMSESEEIRRQQDKAKMSLVRLINANDEALRVFAMWGTNGVLEDTSIITRAYEDLKINNKFECYAWIKVMIPFNQTKFLQSIISQFYVNSLQRQSVEAKQEAADLVDQIPHMMGISSEEDALVNALRGYVNDKRKLKGLHTLRHVHLAWGNTVIQEIERLTQLRKLGVVGINKKNGPAFCSAISKLSHLESLSVRAVGEAGLRELLSTSPPRENLQSLKLRGELGKLPQEWIGKLQNLVKLRLEYTKLENPDAAIKVLGTLPSLAILHLLEYSFKGGEAGFPAIRLKVRPEDEIRMFPSLRMLLVSCSGEVKSVNFETGAMPNLELLHFGFSFRYGAGFFSGLDLLPSLKEFMLPARRFDDGFLEDLQNQLDENPNKPILKRY